MMFDIEITDHFDADFLPASGRKGRKLVCEDKFISSSIAFFFRCLATVWSRIQEEGNRTKSEKCLNALHRGGLGACTHVKEYTSCG